MARIIPVSAFQDPEITQGEKKTITYFFEKLDNSCIIWYQPKLKNSRRPDIIIYIPNIGLIIYEVKDWSLKSIVSANPDNWKINHNGRIEDHTSPFKQSRNYYYQLNEKLKKVKELCADGKKGKLKFPIATAVVFPNISKQSYIDARFYKVIETRYILFKEDLNLSDSNPDLSRNNLLQKLKEHFNPWWENNKLSINELDLLRGTLYPEITAVRKDINGQEQIIVLDEFQEQIAKKIGGGHKIIRGVAGSGKSLVLCSKARLLLEEHPDWKILITCYNVSLESVLKHYINSFFSSNGDNSNSSQYLYSDNILVLNFHSLCSKILKAANAKWPDINEKEIRDKLAFKNLKVCEVEKIIENEKSNALGIKIQELLSSNSFDKFDAILVDESQDFHTSWLKCLTMLLNNSNFLLLAEDPNQKIYSRDFTYKEAGIDVVGRNKVHHLPISYRSSKNIILTSSKLIVKSRWDEFYQKYIIEEKEYSSKGLFTKKGAFPQIIVNDKYNEICDFIVKEINMNLDKFSYKDFCIIYLVKSHREYNGFFGNKNIEYVQTLTSKFLANKIPFYWLSENQNSKRNYNLENNAVTISSAFSAKGLEFNVVFIVGMELYDWKLRNERENASLLYVQMTRAKEKLYLLSLRQNSIIQQIENIIAELKNN